MIVAAASAQLSLTVFACLSAVLIGRVVSVGRKCVRAGGKAWPAMRHELRQGRMIFAIVFDLLLLLRAYLGV